MRSRPLLAAAALVAALSLTACAGAKKGAEQSPETSQQGAKQQKTQSSQSGGNPIATGVDKMRSQMEDLRAAVNAGDAAAAQKAARATDDAWEKFEDAVKAKSKDLYEKTEEPLNAVLAGVKQTPLDQQTLNDQLDKLNGQLDQLTGKQAAADKEPKTVDIKTGAAAMRQHLADLKTAVAAGDTAQAQQAATDADDTWDKFEDAVKAKDKTAYYAIEDPLHAILAGVKQAPLDAKTLNAQIAKLDGLLAAQVK